ncbi:cupin-like domain-containing protein [Sphingomonas panacisoli]|uniref:Cupin-like domain-containing protein n=1 Tax=Sphingomonas panacisoli TaxID=1813879 RepID=A0A5B8LME9_9SPHN|nr:cupin-like domain-containing protein [Sphingomonas panacisoli]QDZ08764.1 cupin-like domain-containing protein [Sphingomonas panacisoli]
MPAIREIPTGEAVDLSALNEPVVFRGIAADWPLVKASDPFAYLAQFDTGAPVSIVNAPPSAEGRLTYDADLSKLDFDRRTGTLAGLFAQLSAASGQSDPPGIAAQAVMVPEALPGFEAANGIALVPSGVAPRIWIGNRVRVATHQDMNSNIAVVAAGRRRFRLFPPGQVGNLYIGPFEFTPAGTPVSLFDPDEPDFDLFPLAAEAMAQSRVVELAPGDALFIPHMWWHHVRSLDAIGILVNYWWDEASPRQPGLAPIDTMVHAILAFGDLPANQREAWRAMFEHFVFGPPPEHLAPDKRGIRGELSEASKERVRRQLGQMMAR